MPLTQEEKVQVVQTHYVVIKQALGSDEKACEFMAWCAKFFSEKPDVLRDISDPKTRDFVFNKAASLMNNPLLKMF